MTTKNRIKIDTFQGSGLACDGREAPVYVDGVRVGFVSSTMRSDKHVRLRAIDSYSFYWTTQVDRYDDFCVRCFGPGGLRVRSAAEAMRLVKQNVLRQIGLA